MKSIVFWQNAPSLHMAPLIKAIAAVRGQDVAVVAERDLSEDRRALGWDLLDHGRATLHISPSEGVRSGLERTLATDSYHVFSGLGVYPKTTNSLRVVSQQHPAHIAVYSEPWNPRGVRGYLRPAKFRSKLRSLGGQIDTFLMMGALGVAQFTALGAPRDKVFPFAYFVEQSSLPPSIVEMKGDYSIVFVGKLESRKNLDLLLCALSGLAPQWMLKVVGDGPCGGALRAKAVSLGIESRVHFLGVQTNSEARKSIMHADLLVLPSVFDGWGAVVNEALDVGVRVLMSDGVGSADLVSTNGHGSVFENNNVTSLRIALAGEIGGGRPTTSDRSALSRWAHERISPAAGADYLMDVLQRKDFDVVPVAPWRRETVQ